MPSKKLRFLIQKQTYFKFTAGDSDSWQVSFWAWVHFREIQHFKINIVEEV